MDKPKPTLRNDDAGRLSTLLGAVSMGDRAAFESLYRATSPRLFGICVHLLRDRAEAEDVLQEIYTGVWHKAKQFDSDRASAWSWLAAIARNKAIDRLRALPARGAFASQDLLESIEDPAASPSQEAQTMTDRSRLAGCLSQLDQRGRTLIKAAFFDGSTYEELAARSGSPLGSVKSWIRRGLLQLRACLQ
jgi:RNA polymerase sigma-70 factor, ECF subfamily